jgi:hypothetical protein
MLIRRATGACPAHVLGLTDGDVGSFGRQETPMNERLGCFIWEAKVRGALQSGTFDTQKAVDLGDGPRYLAKALLIRRGEVEKGRPCNVNHR